LYVRIFRFREELVVAPEPRRRLSPLIRAVKVLTKDMFGAFGSAASGGGVDAGGPEEVDASRMSAGNWCSPPSINWLGGIGRQRRVRDRSGWSIVVVNLSSGG